MAPSPTELPKSGNGKSLKIYLQIYRIANSPPGAAFQTTSLNISDGHKVTHVNHVWLGPDSMYFMSYSSYLEKEQILKQKLLFWRKEAPKPKEVPWE
jgi:hypothetical protein